MYNDNEYTFDIFDVSPIALLGYSNNNIVEVKELKELSEEYREKLSRAYSLIEEVQVYLYKL